MFDTYAAQMLDYYTNRVNPQTDEPGQSYAEEWDREMATDGHCVQELAKEIQRVFAGRDVLELAAGLGRWTRPLLMAANSVLTTDASPRVLPRLPDGAAWGMEVPDDKFRCMKLNAFRPNEAPGNFNGALAVNWFEHIPRQLIPQWIGLLHTKMLPGSTVMIAVNHLTHRARARLFSKPNDPNLYAPRYTFDDRRIEIIDNIFSEPDLREIFKPFARNFCFFCGAGHYWITYEPIVERQSRGATRQDYDWWNGVVQQRVA